MVAEPRHDSRLVLIYGVAGTYGCCRRITAALLAGAAVVIPDSPNPLAKSVIPFAISAAAAANEVLILGSTVTGGTASLEGQRITADGFVPVVVDDATWKSMTTAQFASYRAIVIGDPNCHAYGDKTYLAAAMSNPATWGAAINGNVLIIGTDPVLHSGGTLSSNPGQLVVHEEVMQFTLR